MEWSFLGCSYAKAHEHSAGVGCNIGVAIGKVESTLPVPLAWMLL